MKLDALLKDGTATLLAYDASFPKTRRERLQDLGLLPETIVKRLYTAPMGDPIAFEVHGSVLCLRREDAHRISIEPQEKA